MEQQTLPFHPHSLMRPNAMGRHSLCTLSENYRSRSTILLTLDTNYYYGPTSARQGIQ